VTLYANAAELARASDDRQLRLPAEYGVWAGSHVSEEVASALAAAERMRDDATQARDGDLELMARRVQAISLTMSGRLDEARAAFAAAEALYDPTRHRALTTTTGTDPIVGIHCYRAMTELALGHPDRAVALAAAQDLARLTDAVSAQAYVLWHTGALAGYARLSDRTIALGRELCALSNDRGLSFWAALGPGLVGMGLLDSGDVAGALDAFAQYLEAAEASGARLLAALPRAAMAEAMARTGDAGAFAVAATAEAHAVRAGAFYALSEAQRRQGVVLRLLHPDDRGGADAAFRRAVATARGQNARLWGLRAMIDLARLLGEDGRGPEARALLAPLYSWFTQGFDTPDLADAQVLLKALA
jgi:tetratricopeptide (TPR) repeat protein